MQKTYTHRVIVCVFYQPLVTRRCVMFLCWVVAVRNGFGRFWEPLGKLLVNYGFKTGEELSSFVWWISEGMEILKLVFSKSHFSKTHGPLGGVFQLFLTCMFQSCQLWIKNRAERSSFVIVYLGGQRNTETLSFLKVTFRKPTNLPVVFFSCS